MNPLSKVPSGKDPQKGEVNAFIEIPKGSDVKYELDEDSGVVFVDRFLYTAMVYPFNYGFLVGSQGEDGDPLDMCIISTKAVQPGTVLPCRVIGLLVMEDEGGVDTKILAAPAKKIDPLMAKIIDVSDLEDLTRQKIKHFFDHMKELEPGKWVKTGEYQGTKEAIDELMKAISRYATKQKK